MFSREHRAMERFDMQMPVSIKTSPVENGFEMVTRNVCAGGAFCETPEPLPIGTKVDVDLMLSLKDPGRKTRIQVRGEVIRVEQQGMAVRFNQRFRMQAVTY